MKNLSYEDAGWWISSQESQDQWAPPLLPSSSFRPLSLCVLLPTLFPLSPVLSLSPRFSMRVPPKSPLKTSSKESPFSFNVCNRIDVWNLLWPPSMVVWWWALMNLSFFLDVGYAYMPCPSCDCNFLESNFSPYKNESRPLSGDARDKCGSTKWRFHWAFWGSSLNTSWGKCGV